MDVTQSWEQLLKWHEELRAKLPDALRADFPIIVLANKIDGPPTEADEAMVRGLTQAHMPSLLPVAGLLTG